MSNNSWIFTDNNHSFSLCIVIGYTINEVEKWMSIIHETQYHLTYGAVAFAGGTNGRGNPVWGTRHAGGMNRRIPEITDWAILTIVIGGKFSSVFCANTWNDDNYDSIIMKKESRKKSCFEITEILKRFRGRRYIRFYFCQSLFCAFTNINSRKNSVTFMSQSKLTNMFYVHLNISQCFGPLAMPFYFLSSMLVVAQWLITEPTRVEWSWVNDYPCMCDLLTSREQVTGMWSTNLHCTGTQSLWERKGSVPQNGLPNWYD